MNDEIKKKTLELINLLRSEYLKSNSSEILKASHERNLLMGLAFH